MLYEHWCLCFCVDIFFYSFRSIYLGVKLWTNTVILCLTLGELLSTVVILWFQFLHLLTNTYFLCLYSFNTHFVENLLGVKPTLGVGDAEGLRCRLVWQDQGTKTGNSGCWLWVKWRMGDGRLIHKGCSTDFKGGNVYAVVSGPCYCSLPSTHGPGGQGAKYCYLKSPILFWKPPIRAYFFVLKRSYASNTNQMGKLRLRGDDVPKVTLEDQSSDLQNPAWGPLNSDGMNHKVDRMRLQ